VDWAAISRIDTLVFLMCVHNLARIAANLIAHGRHPETPAALIQMAFWPEERVVTATLATIGEAAEREQIKPPATLVVGDVVGIREKLRAAERDLAPDSADG